MGITNSYEFQERTKSVTHAGDEPEILLALQILKPAADACCGHGKGDKEADTVR